MYVQPVAAAVELAACSLQLAVRRTSAKRKTRDTNLSYTEQQKAASDKTTASHTVPGS